ncbi:MAG: TolC family protein [Planctomycetota bacterium]
MTARSATSGIASRRVHGWRAGLAAIAIVASHAWPAAAPVAPLTVAELLAAVDRAFPLVAQARADVDAARGDRQAADGAFDTTLRAGALTAGGDYDNDRASLRLSQPIAPWGLTAFGGLATGRGTFAPYDGKADTKGAAEFTAGLTLPLLRGRAIDDRRAARATTTLGVDRAEDTLDQARLSAFRTALGHYWDWVAAARQRGVARALLDLAEARDAQLADAVTLGQIAPIERLDNRRAILQRRSALVAAERLLEQRAIDLSLYLRDAAGQPQRPDAARVPAEALDAPATVPDEGEAVQLALSRRPDLAARRVRREERAVDLRLADNGRLPTLDLSTEMTRDANGLTRGLELGVGLTWPFQQRKADGQRAKARAALTRADSEIRWLEDQIRADVQDALSAVRAATGVLDAVVAEAVLARELEQLERDRFTLGDSTQFLVNLRELATADAAVREIRARADVQKARAALDAALGTLAPPVTP